MSLSFTLGILTGKYEDKITLCLLHYNYDIFYK